ncbi:MAG: hypothetical protein ACKO8I_15285 [Cyanobacteriota bacterium]
MAARKLRQKLNRLCCAIIRWIRASLLQPCGGSRPHQLPLHRYKPIGIAQPAAPVPPGQPGSQGQPMPPVTAIFSNIFLQQQPIQSPKQLAALLGQLLDQGLMLYGRQRHHQLEASLKRGASLFALLQIKLLTVRLGGSSGSLLLHPAKHRQPGRLQQALRPQPLQYLAT